MTADKVYWCPRCKRSHVRIHQAVPDKPTGYTWQLVTDFAVAMLVLASVFVALVYGFTK